MKNQKGITLIALIITVIVMVIMAAAAISLVWGQDNMIRQVENAVTNYETKATETQNSINTLEQTLNNYISNN